MQLILFNQMSTDIQLTSQIQTFNKPFMVEISVSKQLQYFPFFCTTSSLITHFCFDNFVITGNLMLPSQRWGKLAVNDNNILTSINAALFSRVKQQSHNWDKRGLVSSLTQTQTQSEKCSLEAHFTDNIQTKLNRQKLFIVSVHNSNQATPEKQTSHYQSVGNREICCTAKGFLIWSVS